jgi:hypothetical protein
MAATAAQSSAAYSSRHSRVGTTGPAARPIGVEHHADADRVGREHLAEQGDGRQLGAPVARRGDRAGHGLARGRSCSIAPASTSLASAWVGTPKPGTSMPIDAHAVDRLRQQLQRHARWRSARRG